MTLAALGFDPNGMRNGPVLNDERYGVVTGRAGNAISRVSGPGEFRGIDKKILSLSGSQILARMTFKAFFVRRRLRLWSAMQTNNHDQ